MIRPEDLERKYTRELFANEIVLLSYYIAAINIETVYGEVAKEHGLGAEYMPFNGMVLTDTFQLSESSHHLDLPAFRANSERAERELEQDIRVIVMNPPYSAGQKKANDNNQNEKYPKLDERIENTYVAHSTATLKNSMYDSYIRAIRWASDRVKDSGVIAFISNGSFIDGKAADGLRKCLVDEFSKLYVYNLRGQAINISGQARKREAGNVFGGGSRTSIAICVLVKDPSHTGEAVLRYRDIGDYLSREEKLGIIDREGSIAHTEWEVIVPNEAADWINQRDEKYDTYQPIGDKATKGKPNTPGIFQLYSNGLKTNRDAWVYNFSTRAVEENVRRMIEFYNSEVDRYRQAASPAKKIKVDDFITRDSTQFSWDAINKTDIVRGKKGTFDPSKVRASLYRPFCKQSVYFDLTNQFNNRTYQLQKLFPTPDHENIAIIASVAGTKDFSVLITDTLPDLHLVGDAQTFSLYTYEPVVEDDGGFNFNLGGGEVVDGYTRRENITDATLATYRGTYGDEGIAKEDIFYYIYALLHHPEYREKYVADLKKMLPRIPLVKGFWEYSHAGRALVELHLGYESVEPYPLDEVASSPAPEDSEERFEFYRVQKMKFESKKDKTRIKYNGHLTLKGIPEEAYEYQVNGKSALGWVVDRYQVKPDKDSNITNDPNDYCRAVNDPRYIVDLIKRLVTVSLETQKLVGTLPRFEVLEDNA